ncbi:hypothetical protein, partial [Paenibacillus sp.]|uniref:hypothetical protein n=1 Tax=Paenibacillus sp. TaxID=58172 RepID=UPI0028ADCF9E
GNYFIHFSHVRFGARLVVHMADEAEKAQKNGKNPVHLGDEAGKARNRGKSASHNAKKPKFLESGAKVPYIKPTRHNKFPTNSQ